MKKKYSVTHKDKKEWFNFLKNLKTIENKDAVSISQNNPNKVKKLDLHGFSILEANSEVEIFLFKSFDEGCSRALIVTGKGLRSKVYKDPYRSEKINSLKYSVPEYIKNNQDLMSIINKITEADNKDGGSGAINVFFKNKKKLQNKF